MKRLVIGCLIGLLLFVTGCQDVQPHHGNGTTVDPGHDGSAVQGERAGMEQDKPGGRPDMDEGVEAPAPPSTSHPMQQTGQISETFCPQVTAASVDHPPADALHVAPQDITQEVHAGDMIFRLPKGWTFHDGRIYAEMAGQLVREEWVGTYSLLTYGADQPGYPVDAPAGAEVEACNQFGGYAPDVEMRRMTVRVPESTFGVSSLQEHYQYIAYGPVKNQIRDLAIFGSVASDTAQEIGSSLRPNEQKEVRAVIRLDAEPRLDSYRAQVTPEEMSYTVRFSEPMNERATEEAIQSGGKVYGPKAAEPQPLPGMLLPVTYAFDWTDDRTLKVEVTLPDGKREGMYRINVRGAVTQADEVLREEVSFTAVVNEANQIWEVSSDGKEKRELTQFAIPYEAKPLQDDRTMLLRRRTYYCECDAPPSFLYSLYDRKIGQVQDSPYPLSLSYMGPGSFVEDPRGFLYPLPHDADAPLLSEGERKIHIDGYVQAGAFSRDGRRILLLVGQDADQVKGLDLWLYSLDAGKAERVAEGLKGSIPANQVGSGYFPVPVTDDGNAFYFSLDDEENGAIVGYRYRYDWSTGKLGTWSVPDSAKYAASFSSSSDGAYRQYYGNGIYRPDGGVVDADAVRGTWLGHTHRLAYLEREGEEGHDTEKLMIKDVDTGHSRMISGGWPSLSNGWPSGTTIIGGSIDGRTIYLMSPAGRE